MEILMEFLIDLILEGSICLSTNKKVPVFIRYFLIFFIVLFFITIIGGLFVLGIVISYQNKVAGLFVIIISLIFLILCILEFRKKYLIKNKSI